jgi:Ser/Thr protein kinase RdoA (MazF antagonist)
VELLASGRTAEVFVWGDGRVLKLDRPEWNGLAALEASVLATVTDAGVRAPRAHEMVMVGDRHGVVIDRIDGPMLWDVIATATDVDALARTWTELHLSLNARTVAGLPDLVSSLAYGIRTSRLALPLVEELLALLDDLDDGRRALCHFDLHPGNVIVGPDGWVVIDWMTASAGPPDADFARTLVLDPPGPASAHARFMTIVRRDGAQARHLDERRLHGWIRIVAAARLAEGFEGQHAEYLTALASGSRGLDD